MSEIAFHVQGRAVTVEQREAGLAAMVGEFQAVDVRAALARAGVEDEPGQSYTVERAADRLMQPQRRCGCIRAVTNKLWRSVA